ncbi:MAG: cation:proton antiporter domain-containing protein [Thermoplasmatota archaeon]
MGASVLQDLVVVMVVAAGVTILFHRLKQPLVLGYLIAGALIGPYTTPFGLVQDTDNIKSLAEIGLVFLLFSLGLEFNLRKLRRVGLSAIFGAMIEIAVTFYVGWRTGLWLGWPGMDALFMGLILSLSSTTVILKILTDLGKLEEDFAEITFGILIVEDLFGVLVVAMLGGLNPSDGFDVAKLSTILAQLALYVLITLAVGLVLVPKLIDWVAKHEAEEVLVITVVGLVLLNAVLAVRLGLSQTLGAFLTGAVIAESRAVKRVEHKIIPIRDLFTAVFFVAAGMLLDVKVVSQYWEPILIFTAVGVLAKIAGATLGIFGGGYPGRTAFSGGLAFGIFDEFTFIIASLAVAAGFVHPYLYPVAVGVVMLSTFVTPYILRSSDSIVEFAARLIPRRIGNATDRWADHVARRRAEREQRSRVGDSQGARPLIYAAWLLGILIAAAFASAWLSDHIPPGSRFSLGSNVVRAAAFTVLALLSLPLFASFEFSTERWIFTSRRGSRLEPGILRRALPSWQKPKVTSRVLAVIASLGLLAIALRIAWGVNPLFLPDPLLLVPLLALFAAVAAALWPYLLRTYHELDATLDILLGRTEDGMPFARFEGRYPWGMLTEAVRIRDGAQVAFSTLGQLRLEDTGVSIVGIERGGRSLVSPHRDLVLLPNDRVFFIGRSEQTTRAVRVLTGAPDPLPSGGKDPVEAATLEFAVPSGSPAVGCSLDQLALDRAGVRVLHHARRNHESGPPDPLVPLRIGDKLVIRGAPRDVERVRSTLKLGAVPAA